LNSTRVTSRDRLPKVGDAECRSIAVPLRVVEQVIKLGPELQTTRFKLQDTWKILEQRRVRIVEPGSSDDVSSGISELARRGMNECIRIEPHLLRTSAVIRVRKDIRTVRSPADARVVSRERDIDRRAGFKTGDARQLPVAQNGSGKSVVSWTGDIVDIAENQYLRPVIIGARTLQISRIRVLMRVTRYIAADIINGMGVGVGRLKSQPMIFLSSQTVLELVVFVVTAVLILIDCRVTEVRARLIDIERSGKYFRGLGRSGLIDVTSV
jgi:hypothetical protein